MKNKHKHLLLVTIAALASIVIGLLQPPTAEATQEETYLIATDVTFAPFEFLNTDGEYVGIDIDLLEAIAEDQGFDYEIRPMNFSAGIQALEANQVDGMIAGMGITPERAENFDFSEPYMDVGPVVAVHEDNSDINSYDDLNGATVAVKVGTTGAQYANELAQDYDFEINQFEDSASMYEDVMAGHADAAVEDFPVMSYAIQQGLPLRIATEPAEGYPIGFAVNGGQNPELLQMFNDGLENVIADGTYDEIMDRYLGEGAQEGQSGGFFALLTQNFGALMSGLGRTLILTLLSFAISLVAGTIFGLFSIAPNKGLNILTDIYVTIFRGIPLLVLAFFMYFSVPQLFNIQISAFTAGIVTLSLNTTAYISEQVRGGINAVPPGQLEAGRSLGLPYGVSMRKIVLPQAVKIMIPSLINQFVITLKDTSILSVIGIVELTQTGRIIIARSYESGAMWIIIGLIYLIIITLLTKLSNIIERNLIND